MSRALIFPGQGSQYIGMGKALADNFPVARDVFAEVDDALSQKLSALMFDGNEQDLNLTENTQPALMAVSAAVWRVIAKESGQDVADLASFVAGHSLGEYSALTVVGSLGLSDSAKLLRLRGQAMQRAVPVGQGAMAAILGLDFADVENITSEASHDGICEAANDNSTGQVVVSGDKAAVTKATELAMQNGAKKAVELPVSAPFHCRLMQPAADEMQQALNETTIIQPAVPLVANVIAEATDDPEQIRKMLVQQVTGTVRWRESVMWMEEQGVDDMAELGAGKVLSGLVRRIDRNINVTPVETPEQIDGFLKTLG